MAAALIGRRQLLMAGAAAACGAGLVTTPLAAMGRIPVGGKVAASIPYDTSRLDPYDLFDPMSALVGSSVFDPVYALDANGNLYAALADGMPQHEGRITRVRMREGLQSARGIPIDARDLVRSVERARRAGAVALLADIPVGSVDKSDNRAAVFRDTDPAVLAQTLASPLVALTSRISTPISPDGTGAFRAEPSPSRLVLTRNRCAARGPAYLDDIVLLRAADLAEPLRAFEAQTVDIGWLGTGYHQPRPNAVAFDLGAIAWAVLRTGRDAKEWGEPGVAQRLLDAIDPSRLAHLALRNLPAPTGSPAWGGAPCELLAPSSSPHLAEIGRTLASILSAPSHEVTLSLLPSNDIAQRRKSGAYALLLDLVRPVGPAGVATLVALATADQGAQARSIVRHPPRLSSFAPRALARTLRLGVIGEIRVAGATIPALKMAAARDGYGWDLGSSHRLHNP